MLNISPSRIARYFYHECERYLVYQATPSDEKASKNIPSSPYDHSPVTRAMLEAGYKWEEKVIQDLINNKKKVYKAPKKDKKRLFNQVHDEKTTIKILRTMSEEQYLYQGCLTIPQSFYDSYNLDKSNIKLSTCFPDLIYACKNENGLEFRIIDIKASKEMKISHKIQVALYALFLSYICKENGINGKVDFSNGGVWAYGLTEPEWFNINTVIPQVEEMLCVDIPRISETDSQSIHWHIHYRCEWCEYYDSCRKEAEQSKSISLIPYLSPMGRKYLAEDEGIEDLISMRDFLSHDSCRSSIARCASLSGKQERLTRMVNALLDNEIYTFDSSSVSMPVRENIKLLLTIQKDPVSGKIYTSAFLRNGSDEIFKSAGITEKQFVATTIEDCTRIRREFINHIYEIFKEVHDYNMSKEEWSEQKSLQTYVFDSFEWEMLKELLIEGLKDPLTADKSLALFFYFHSESLLINEKHPEIENSFPVVIIINVIRSLFALPVPVAYQLADVLDVFNSATGKKFNYKPMEYFTFKISNSLKSDAVYKIWHNKETKQIKWIEDELRKRLLATSYILSGIRHCASKFLFAWPPKFSLPESKDFNNFILSRLDFITRYEVIMNCLSVREMRTLPRNEREYNGIAFSLTSTGEVKSVKGSIEARFSLKETENLRNLDPAQIWSWILSEDITQGEKDHMSFPDYFYRNMPAVPGNKALYVAHIKDDIESDKDNIYITLDLKKGKISPEIIKGEKYLLQPRFTDWTSQRVVSRLREIDSQDEPEAVKLLQNPVDYCEDINEIKKIKKHVEKIADMMPLTESQREAFNHLFNKTLTLLWGPPGTGKTYFIALAMLCLLEVHRKADITFKILLSAFTHTAIENCLKKIIQLNSSLKIWKDEFTLAKLDRRTDRTENIPLISPREYPGYISDNPRCILGGTTYSMSKIFDKKDDTTPFDMVVIDEGSQLRVPESLLVISRLKPGGRLLIAGDDKQLPPIIKGYYPDPEPDEPLLHRSIFEALRNPDKENKITCQLYENFRMNKTLCLYPAEKIYGEKYKSASKEIATGKLLLSKSSKSESLIETILDPKYSLILCITEDIRTGAENQEEADLVAKIALALRKRLLMKDTGKPYPDDPEGDKQFWKDGLFIVSPHHVQIDAICNSLSERGLREPYFVGTVDKMQGQECDSVIVSYGVSDPELAIYENVFIYSLNRLNVSITRAKCKTIVFLSRYLLTPTLQVLTKLETEEGIYFMMGLERFAAKGKETIFKPYSDPDASLIVYRI